MGLTSPVRRGVIIIAVCSLQIECFVRTQDADSGCTGISKKVGCTECTAAGHCMPGKVPVDPWLSFATKTQRELQIDEPWNRLQKLDAHNGFNARVFGYGENDTCNWPPPYDDDWCVTVANQVFSFTDLLNMGIRALELDIWWCPDGAMRMDHLLGDDASGCKPTARLYSDGIKEIADWLELPGNDKELVQVYLNEKSDQGHDDEVNGPLEQYLGKRILTPAELRGDYRGVWPTMRQMRKAGKNVVVVSGSEAGSDEVYTHGDIYIHKIYWEDLKAKFFTKYPTCGAKNDTNMIRYYSDGTHYGLIYDGTNATGIILDFTEYVKCRVQFPATDFITPDLIETALFTWAVGQPSSALTADSCVFINKNDWRWYLSDDCSIKMYHACQSLNDPDDWTTSASPGPYRPIGGDCPAGYKFSVPQDGYRNQQLRKSSGSNSLWINYSPWLPEPAGSAAPSIDLSFFSAFLLVSAVTVYTS